MKQRSNRIDCFLESSPHISFDDKLTGYHIFKTRDTMVLATHQDDGMSGLGGTEVTLPPHALIDGDRRAFLRIGIILLAASILFTLFVSMTICMKQRKKTITVSPTPPELRTTRDTYTVDRTGGTQNETGGDEDIT